MALGAFACVLMMRRDGKAVEDIGELAGLSRTNPWMAFALSMMMFSLAGIPPLAGFWAKFYVFLAAIDAKLYTLAVVGVSPAVVSAPAPIEIDCATTSVGAAPASVSDPAPKLYPPPTSKPYSRNSSRAVPRPRVMMLPGIRSPASARWATCRYQA